MSGNSTSRAKLPRSSSRPGVIQLGPAPSRPPSAAETDAGPSAPVAALKSGTPGNCLQAELLVRRDDQLHRALDLRAVRTAGCRSPSTGTSSPATARSRNCSGAARRRAGLPGLGRELLAHEVAIDLAGDEFGGDRLLQDDVDHLRRRRSCRSCRGTSSRHRRAGRCSSTNLRSTKFQPVKARAASRMSFSV